MHPQPATEKSSRGPAAACEAHSHWMTSPVALQQPRAATTAVAGIVQRTQQMSTCTHAHAEQATSAARDSDRHTRGVRTPSQVLANVSALSEAR